jgi:hypothetical protein
MNRKSLSALVARWPAFQPEAGLCRRASLVAAFMIAGTAAATSSAQTAAAPAAESALPVAATPAEPAAAQPQPASDWRSVFKMSSRLIAPAAGASAAVPATPRAAAPAAAPSTANVAAAAATVPAAAVPAQGSAEPAKTVAPPAGASGAQAVLAQAPVAPVTPTAPAAAQRSATWDVRVADVAISRTLKRWGEQAGYQVVWSSPKDFPVAATASITGDFHEALKTIIESLAQTDSPVMAVYYLNNVVQIVRYTGQAAELKGKN